MMLNLNIEEIQLLLVQIIGAIGVIWAAWSKVWVKHLSPILKKKATDLELERMAKIFIGTRHLLRDWRIRHSAMRVLCLSAKNNGSPWPPDSDLKVSCLDQSVSIGVQNTWNTWQGEVIDADYREMLFEVIQKKARGVLLITSSMPDCVLRDAYLEQGTVASVVFPIHWIAKDNSLIYISMNFGEPLIEDPDNPGQVLPMPDENRISHEKQARALFDRHEALRRLVKEGNEIWKLRN